jgi:hypothetical protein
VASRFALVASAGLVVSRAQSRPTSAQPCLRAREQGTELAQRAAEQVAPRGHQHLPRLQLERPPRLPDARTLRLLGRPAPSSTSSNVRTGQNDDGAAVLDRIRHGRGA